MHACAHAHTLNQTVAPACSVICRDVHCSAAKTLQETSRWEPAPNLSAGTSEGSMVYFKMVFQPLCSYLKDGNENWPSGQKVIIGD